jgi:hypothetical protein
MASRTTPRIKALEILGFEYKVMTLRDGTACEILATDPHNRRHFSFPFARNPDGTIDTISIYGASFPAESDKAHMALMARGELFLRTYPALRAFCEHCHCNGCVVDTDISGEIIDHANAYEQGLRDPDDLVHVMLPRGRGTCTAQSFNCAKYMAGMFQAAIWSRSGVVREQGFVNVPLCVCNFIHENCREATPNRFVIKRLGTGGRFPVENLMHEPNQAEQQPELAVEAPPDPVAANQPAPVAQPAVQALPDLDWVGDDQPTPVAQPAALPGPVAEAPPADDQPAPAAQQPGGEWLCCECKVPFTWNWSETGRTPLTCFDCGSNLCPLCLGILHATRVQNTPIGGNNVRWVPCPNPKCRKEKGFDARDPKKNVTLIRLLDQQRP